MRPFFLFSVATLHYAIRRKNDLLTDQMSGIFANSRTLHGLEEPWCIDDGKEDEMKTRQQQLLLLFTFQ